MKTTIPQTMTTKVFVYGTLRPDCGGMADEYPTQEAKIDGLLFDMGGHYPGMIRDKTRVSELNVGPRNQKVVGHILEVPESHLGGLDAYEGYDHTHPELSTNLYRRISVTARLGWDTGDVGEEVTCWVYEYNQPITNVRSFIPSGDWKDFHVVNRTRAT
ncbi:MAG: gamma-glutamylcyclotransferase [Bacteroidales bacterium]|nr:gamma-glutamylcyclotransferase [Candidatus Latescibacterota bacterium]